MLACLWVHDRRFHLLLSLVACFAGAGRCLVGRFARWLRSAVPLPSAGQPWRRLVFAFACVAVSCTLLSGRPRASRA
ncbi:hypothetical protein BC567DRAFT_234113 [Phyllosticta citribraziliensis]